MRTHHPSTVASTFSQLLPIVRTTVSVLLLALLCTACNTDRSRLEAAVKAESAKFPAHFEYGEITSLAMDGDDVVYNMTYNDDVMYFVNLLHSTGGLKEFMKSSATMTLTDEGSKEVLALIADAGAGLRFDIKGESGSSSISVALTTDEIKGILDNDEPAVNTTIMMMKAMCKAMNDACPFEIDPVTTAESINMTDDNMLVYNYIINEELMEISVRDLPFDELKAEYVDDIKNPNGELRKMAEVCASCNIDLAYRFKGSSTGQTGEVTFTASELKKLIQ